MYTYIYIHTHIHMCMDMHQFAAFCRRPWSFKPSNLGGTTSLDFDALTFGRPEIPEATASLFVSLRGHFLVGLLLTASRGSLRVLFETVPLTLD